MKFIVYLLLFTASFTVAKAQSLNTGKYRVNFPQNMPFSRKVLNTLPDILPAIFSQLKDKEICGDDCIPLHYVSIDIYNFSVTGNEAKLTMASPVADANLSYDSYDIYTNYVFEAALVLSDTSGKEIARVMLVSPEERWSAVYHEKIRTSKSYNPYIATQERGRNANRANTVSTANGSLYAAANVITAADMGYYFSADEFISRNRSRFPVELRHLVSVLEKKILALRID